MRTGPQAGLVRRRGSRHCSRMLAINTYGMQDATTWNWSNSPVNSLLQPIDPVVAFQMAQ